MCPPLHFLCPSLGVLAALASSVFFSFSALSMPCPGPCVPVSVDVSPFVALSDPCPRSLSPPYVRMWL